MRVPHELKLICFKRNKKTFVSLFQIVSVWTLLLVSACSGKVLSEGDNGPEAIIMSNENESFVILSTETGQKISDNSFTVNGEFSEVSDGVFWMKRNGEYWLYSAKSPSISMISIPYKMVTNFAAGRAAVGDGISPIRIINNWGEVVKELPKNIIEVYPFSKNGLAAFRDGDNHLCGYIDTDGNVKIPSKFSFAYMFNDGYALVMEGDGSEARTLLIDTEGKPTDGNLDDVYNFYTTKVSSGVIPIIKYYNDEDEQPNERLELMYIKPDGKHVLSVEMNETDDSSTLEAVDGCVVFYGINGKYGVKTLDNKVILQCYYDAIQIISSKAFIVQRNYETAVIGEGDKIIDGYYEYPTRFYPLGNGRYVKCSPDPNSIREQIIAGPGGDPIVMKANSYWIFNDKGKRLSNGFSRWVNKVPLLGYEPVHFTDASGIFSSVLTQINPESVFGFKPLTTVVDVASKFDWNVENYANFYGKRKQYGFELPGGNYQTAEIEFTEDMLRPVTHKEMRESGRINNEEEVTDGYEFNPDARLESVIIEFNQLNGAQPSDLLPILNNALESKGFKVVSSVGTGISKTYSLCLEKGKNYVEVKTSARGENVILEITIPKLK